MYLLNAANLTKVRQGRNISACADVSSSSDGEQTRAPLAFVRRKNGDVTVERWPQAPPKEKPKQIPYAYPYPVHYYYPPYAHLAQPNTYGPPPNVAHGRSPTQEPRALSKDIPSQEAAVMSGALPLSTAVEAKKRKRMPRSESSSSSEQVKVEEPEAAPSWDGVKLHYCYRCGRARSKRFHRENAQSAGSRRVIGLCSRCKKQEPRRSPWGYTSGNIVGERWVVRPYRVRKSRKTDEDEAPEPAAPRTTKSKQESRVIELSSSSSGSSAGVEESPKAVKKRKLK